MSEVIKCLPGKGELAEVFFPALPELPVWIYQPERLSRADRVIVAVHGISREGEEQARAMKEVADQLGCWVLAPVFNKKAYPRYQQLGKGEGYPRADLAMNTLLTLWRAIQGQPWLKAWLCGYSGGAQFVHRYAFHYPEQLAALIVSSAGWYSFPDSKVNYPRGMKDTVPLGNTRLSQMLALPILITVGELDNARDDSLRKNISVDQQQGLTRYSRALNWGEAIRSRQLQKGLAPASLKVLAGQKHSFIENMKQGSLAEIIHQFLIKSEGNLHENNKRSFSWGASAPDSRMPGKTGLCTAE